MKKVMFALCFMFGGIVTVVAQDQQDTTSNQYRTETQSQYPQDALGQDQDRERIQSTELPDEVKRSLEGEEYRGWLVSGAFKAKASAGQSMESDTTSVDPNQQADPSNNAAGMEEEEVYIVELKNGAETKTIRFDANGQKIEGLEGQEGEGMDQNNQFNQNEQMNQNELPAPADQTTPAPADQTTPAPEDQTVPTPDDQVTPAPEGQTESNQYNETETDPSSETETDPASETETESTETESEQSIDESPAETEETSTETGTESTTDRP